MHQSSSLQVSSPQAGHREGRKAGLAWGAAWCDERRAFASPCVHCYKAPQRALSFWGSFGVSSQGDHFKHLFHWTILSVVSSLWNGLWLIAGRLTQCHDMGSESQAGLWLVMLQQQPGC